MTTERSALATIAIVVAALCGAFACGSGAGLDVRTLPPEIHAPYRRFEARCSRCHSLSRPLSAPVNSVDHWEKYVARMRRMPGSGINAQDAAIILTFLAYYTEVVRGGGEWPRPEDTQGGEAIEGSVPPAPVASSEPAPPAPADDPTVPLLSGGPTPSAAEDPARETDDAP